jgi:hypothetical protein
MAAITSPSTSIVNGSLAIPAEGQTFTRFPKLPLELRNIVWEYASNQPRNLDIWASTTGTITFQRSSEAQKYEYYAFKYYTTQPVPGILHASQESRTAALQFYDLSFGIGLTFESNDNLTFNSAPRIYRNFGADRICPMGPWGFDAQWYFWSLVSPLDCAINI